MKLAVSNAADGSIIKTLLKDCKDVCLRRDSFATGKQHQIRITDPGYYSFEVYLENGGKVISSKKCSFVITTPLPEDYYTTPYPAFGVWGGLDARLRRLGGAKWDRRLFFTIFQKKDGKCVPPTPEEVANREPVKIINCLNILNPFKRMVPLPKSVWAKTSSQLKTAIVRRRGLVDVWETQNEPMVGENFHGSMSDVMDIIKLESDAVRKYDPGTPIAGICINPMSQNQYAQYISYYKNYDIQKYIDAVMLHPYIPGARSPDASGYVETLNRLGADLKKISGKEIPMYISEIGYSTKPGGEVTELQQAAYLARVVMLNQKIKNLVACVWHIGLWNDATSRRELDFGILRPFPKGSKQREPKPAFAAWATVSRETYNAQFIKELEFGRGIKCMLFKRSNKALLVCYAVGGNKKQLKIVVNAPEVKITNVCGRTEIRKLKNGVLITELGEDPVYISGGRVADYIGQGYSAVFTPEYIKQYPGSSGQLSIALPDRKIGTGSWIKTEFPRGWKTAMSKNANTWKIAYQVPADCETGNTDVYIKLYKNKQCLFIWQKNIEILPPLSLDKLKSVVTAKVPGIEFTVRPVDSRLKNNACRMIIKQNSKSICQKSIIPGKKYFIPLPNMIYGRKNRYEAEISLANGYRWNVALPDIAVIPVPLQKKDIKFPFPAWTAKEGYDLAGGVVSRHFAKGVNDKISGQLYLSGNSQYLFIGARLLDKHYRPEKSIASLWKGDSLQIGISVPAEYMIRKNNDGIQETSYAEFGVRQSNERPSSWVWASMNRSLMELNKPVPGLLSSFTRSGDVSVLKIAVPWKTLNIKPAAGMPFGISILVNDLDDSRHWVEWYSGIANGKDPGLYGRAVLK